MHKTLQILIWLALLSTPAFSQRGGLLGKVKMIHEKLAFLDTTMPHYETYSSRSAAENFHTLDEAIKFCEKVWVESPVVAFLDYSREYDTQGLLTGETWHHKSGRLKERNTYLYDSCDRMIVKKSMFIYRKDTQYTVERFKFNDCGFLISSIETSTLLPDKFYYNWNIYDENNRLIRKKHFIEGGETYGEKFSYNSKGQMIARYTHKPFIQVILPDGTKDSKPDDKGEDDLVQTYEYDSAGNHIKTRGYKEDKLSGSRTWTYDSNNRKTGEYYYSTADTFYASRQFTYDEGGRILSETYQQGRDNFYTIEYEYDPNSKLLKKTVYNENGKTNIIMFWYRFDERGNWVEQVKEVDRKEWFKRIREIAYY